MSTPFPHEAHRPDSSPRGARVTGLPSPIDGHGPPSVAFSGFSSSINPLDDLPRPLVEPLRAFVARYALQDAAAFPTPLAVTSSLHGEGVTTVSTALSWVLATDLHTTVCRVDLSWADRPAPMAPVNDGIYEILTGAKSLSGIIEARRGVIELGAGAVPAEERRAMARAPELTVLIEQLAARVGIVVLDTPPLLGGSEGLSMLRHAAGALLVARHGVTTTSQLKASVAGLDGLDLTGVIMNRYRSRVPRRLLGLLS